MPSFKERGGTTGGAAGSAEIYFRIRALHRRGRSTTDDQSGETTEKSREIVKEEDDARYVSPFCRPFFRYCKIYISTVEYAHRPRVDARKRTLRIGYVTFHRCDVNKYTFQPGRSWNSRML